MGVMGDNKASPGVLDGLYGVELGRRPSASGGAGDEAVRTTVVEYSVASDRNKLQRLPIRRLWRHRPSFLKPVHCSISCGDKHAGETIANVVTSLPFIILGMQTPRRATFIYVLDELKHSAVCEFTSRSRNSFKFVPFLQRRNQKISSVGRLYYDCHHYIDMSKTSCLSRALRNENPRILMAASTLLLPFQPLMVCFAKRASIEPELRMAHNLHKMSSLLGGALFIADDCFRETPYIHAAWHLAAAIGIGTCNKLLE
uniref:Uncharacterized protein n=1 Tax=Leersia perrieri TaxID=77586 RepID=A0A0D9XDM5_9ORYZ